MKIVFTTKGTDWDAYIDPRFGRAEYFLLYDEENDALSWTDNSESSAASHGAGVKAAQTLIDMKPDIMITGNGPGAHAAEALLQSGIKVFVGAGDMTVKDAYQAFINNELRKF